MAHFGVNRCSGPSCDNIQDVDSYSSTCHKEESKMAESEELISLLKKEQVEFKKQQLEELRSAGKEISDISEKYISLIKEGVPLSNQITKIKSDYTLPTLSYEADSYLKMIDVGLDILKFLIPTLFTIWTVAHVVHQFPEDSNFVLLPFFVCLGLLVGLIFYRVSKVKGYVSRFKKEQAEIALELFNWQKPMVELQQIEADGIRKITDIWNKDYEEVKRMNSST